MYLANQSNNDHHLLRFHSNEDAGYFSCRTSFNPQIWLSSSHAQGSCVSERFHELTEATQLTQAEIQSQGTSDTKAQTLLPLQFCSLHREHCTCLWKSHVEIPWKARALFYDKGRIAAVIVTEQPSYAWQQPMSTRPLKGRLMPSNPFNSDLHLLIQSAFHVPSRWNLASRERERERDTCSIYVVVESFTAFKPHRLELNLKTCLLTSFEESLIFQRMLCLLCTNGLARESG